MTYRVEFTGRSRKQLNEFDATLMERLANAALRLGDNPRPQGCKKVVGTDYFRIRVGMYRILYTIQDDLILVEIVRIAHRSKAYRGL